MKTRAISIRLTPAAEDLLDRTAAHLGRKQPTLPPPTRTRVLLLGLEQLASQEGVSARIVEDGIWPESAR